jgi:hypothetical protein
MDFILNQMDLPKSNPIIERSRLSKNVSLISPGNKLKLINLNSLLSLNNIDNVLKELYSNIFSKQYIIFNGIKYKNIGGIRLEVKGRLTKRYRADRAIFKVKWKGGLKNVDSSFKRLSAVNFRGHMNSNVEYTMIASKRRIGAFAIKGWISGK